MTSPQAHYPDSPVPSDEHLLPGELPFTAFGQHGPGNLDLRVFDQDTYWVDITGTPHLLADMPDRYRRNVISHLRDNVLHHYSGAVTRDAIDMVLDLYTGRPNATLMLSELDQPTTADLDPHVWLESTPLMRRLRALTEHRHADGRSMNEDKPASHPTGAEQYLAETYDPTPCPLCDFVGSGETRFMLHCYNEHAMSPTQVRNQAQNQ